MKKITFALSVLVFIACGDTEKTNSEEIITDTTTVTEEMEKPAIEITQVEVSATPILYVEEQAKLEDDSIALKLGEAYGEIMAFVGVNKLEMAGAPLALTREFSMEEMFWAFNAAIPVSVPENIELIGRIKSGETYQGNAVKAIHIGDYSESMATYDAIDKYIKENNLEVNGQPWEEYVDDPTKVSIEELRTFIYFPIK